MQQNNPSLKKQLLQWLLVPQIASWVAGGALTFSVAHHYVDRYIDENLLDVAETIHALMQPSGSNDTLEDATTHISWLPGVQSRTYYYTVRQIPGHTLTGNRELTWLKSDSPRVTYYRENIDGKKLHAIRVIHSSKADGKLISVQVAKRYEAANFFDTLLITTSIPLIGLTLATAFLLWWGLGHGLKPVEQLKRKIAARHPRDLSPVETHSVPEEFLPVVDALNTLVTSAKENMERQHRFIGDAAHQLRTPLAGLKSQTELAMRETRMEALQGRLAMVHTSATRSIHLVNQLLTLARSEPNNQNSILRVHMDLARLIRELTAESVPRALAAGIDLGCDCDLSEARIEGNSALLRELFINLVENAIKYTPRGSCVTVRLSSRSGYYIVEVEDDGPGIPDENKVHIFERFYRIHQDGTGCGLGMSIVKEIAERHGGSVELRNAVPHGLIVRVELPY